MCKNNQLPNEKKCKFELHCHVIGEPGDKEARAVFVVPDPHYLLKHHIDHEQTFPESFAPLG